MTDEDATNNQETNSENGNQERQENRILEGHTAAPNQDKPKKHREHTDAAQKPSLIVRFWFAMWRKRIFFHRAKTGPNWAEVTGIVVAAMIFLATCVQAYIYWRQTQLMQTSLSQNQQSIALNMGQVAIAGRNAKTAEDTLGELKKGGTDTHTLAQAAQQQAGASQSAADTAREALHISEKAFVDAGSPVFDSSMKLVSVPMENAGRTPSGRVETIVYNITFAQLSPTVIDAENNPVGYGDIVERSKGITHFDHITPTTLRGSQLSINMTLPKSNPDLLRTGAQQVLIVGTVRYNDGFQNSQDSFSYICFVSFYRNETKNLVWTPCNANRYFEYVEGMDWAGYTNFN
jgi:hypothetical protein